MKSLKKIILGITLILSQFVLGQTNDDKKFSYLPEAIRYWLNVSQTEDVYLYTSIELKDYCFLSQYAVFNNLSNENSNWIIKTIADYDFYENRISVIYSEISVNNFGKKLRLPYSGYYFISSKNNPQLKLIARVNSNTISIFSRKNQLNELKSLDSEFGKYKIEKNLYRFGVVELFSEDSCIQFLTNIEDYHFQWNDLILEENFKNMCYLNTSQYLKSLKALNSSGIHPKKGLLLYGPPGTGKTFLGQIIVSDTLQGELKGTNTLFVSTARHLKATQDIALLLKTAAEQSPSTVFIEDIDLIGIENRNDDNNSSSDTKESRLAQDRLNELLNGLDGLTDSEGILSIFTTNQEKNLDSALLRSGRIGLKFYFDLPKFFERKLFFERFGKSKSIWEEGVTSEWLSAETDLFSGADIIESISLAKQYAYLESSITEDGLLLIKKIHFKNAIEFIRSQLNNKDDTFSALNSATSSLKLQRNKKSYLKSFSKLKSF